MSRTDKNDIARRPFSADPAVVPPPRRGPRPVPSGVPYHRALTAPPRRIWRGILALVLLVLAVPVFPLVFAVGALGVEHLFGRGDPAADPGTSVLFLAANLFGLVLLIPWSMLLQRWLLGVRGVSLHSVLSAFRPALVGRAMLLMVPFWVLIVVAQYLLEPLVGSAQWSATTVVGLVAVTMLLTPLQAAGEEYGFRGLVFRIAASWGRGPRTALVLGVAVSSLLFAVVHQQTDLWLNVYYLAFGAAAALITWRTGGLEVAVVLHAANNMLAFLLNIASGYDFLAPRGEQTASVGTPALLVPIFALALVTAVVWWRTRESGPALTPTVPGPTREDG